MNPEDHPSTPDNMEQKLIFELIKAYKSLGKKDLEILNEWEIASREIDQ